MTPEERDKHEYLGDGVYAEFDGEGIWLRTGDHRHGHCDNKIYFEPMVLDDFLSFVKKHYKMKNL